MICRSLRVLVAVFGVSPGAQALRRWIEQRDSVESATTRGSPQRRR